MKSPLCQWLNDLSDYAAKENVIIEAKYFDGLEYFFWLKLDLPEALKRYNDLVRRVTAIQAEYAGSHYKNLLQ